MNEQKIIVVFCHSRAKLLKMCLTSICKASGFSEWKLIVVHQKGYSDVEKVLKKFKNQINTLVSVEPCFDFALGNINYNRILGTKTAFEVFGADYVLGVEEDNLISEDALKFIEFSFKEYKKCASFRGVNLGSVEYGKSVTRGGYSLLRFGLHGSAGVLTKKTWISIKNKKLFEFDLRNPNFAWDAQIEFFLKTGFMVTPNLSRNLDLGHGGTFAPSSSTDPYFKSIKKSFSTGSRKSMIEYKKTQIMHRWRSDAVEFKKIHSILYFLRLNKFIARLSSYVNLTNLVKRFFL